MTQYMTLLGAEEVSNAGRRMSEAGHETYVAAQLISESLIRHQQFMDEWLLRLEAILKENKQ